jgi:hypothetical protein
MTITSRRSSPHAAGRLLVAGAGLRPRLPSRQIPQPAEERHAAGQVAGQQVGGGIKAEVEDAVLGDCTLAEMQLGAVQAAATRQVGAEGEADGVLEPPEVLDLDDTPDQVGQGVVAQPPGDAPDKNGVAHNFSPVEVRGLS